MLIVLRFPHLVLTDVAHDERFAFSQAPEIVDDVGREQPTVVGQVADVEDGALTF